MGFTEDVITTIILHTIGLFIIGGFLAFTIISLCEKERRAVVVSLILTLISGIFFFFLFYLPPGAQAYILILLSIMLVCGVILFLLPIGKRIMPSGSPVQRFDERDVVFTRCRLKPGSLEYDSYYAMRPEKKSIDDRTRTRPGLLSPDSIHANTFHFASAEGSFYLTEALRDAVDGPVSDDQAEITAQELTALLKNLARYYGALDVGITELKPYHVYSHIGRGTGTFGSPIPVEHEFAIAFTVEMDFQFVASGPWATTVMESARQYVEAARVAVQLAAVLRVLGYPARAHIDGNYRVIAPLVARDAGLGEIGRMGLLMTPKQGPRVRLGVVTTNAALITDTYQYDVSVIDSCTVCKKCALNCPCQAISSDDRKVIDGVLRWRIDGEACFLYWNTIGTDCGRCMAVCPYSHPGTLPHNIIRWGAARSGGFRRFALILDDIFYGRRPARHHAPTWTRINDITH